jgi:hypothetical protein
MNCNRSLAQKAEYALAALLLIAIAFACQAQSVGGGAPDRFPKMNPMDDEGMTQEVHRMRMLNAARQKSMVSDADKLLALARDLNAGVGAGGNALSAGQRMKMAADIEKLAHNVREKMTYVAGTPSLTPMSRPPSTGWPQ